MGEKPDSYLPPAEPTPPQTREPRKYRLGWLAASAITAGLLVLFHQCQLVTAGVVQNPFELIIGNGFVFLVLFALAIPVIRFYRRFLRGPEVLDIWVACVVCWSLVVLAGYLLKGLFSLQRVP